MVATSSVKNLVAGKPTLPAVECPAVTSGALEDAFQADAEPPHLASIIGLGAPERQVQSIAVLGRKRSVVCHQQSWAPKQTVLSLRPSPAPNAEHQPFSASIIGILNKLS